MSFLNFLFPSLQWSVSTKEKILFLTFDDGPAPSITENVLKILKQYNARATFFCLGKNVISHPEIYQSILAGGHRTGNHSMNHLNGWKTNTEDYVNDVNACGRIVADKLFRPPYGRIRRSQIRRLKKDYRIVMWNVLSRDYARSYSAQACFETVKKQSREGSIIVFHDSEKAAPQMLPALGMTLEYFTKKGFRFEAIPG